MEFLKEVLGEELYNQVAEKLKGNDKIKLANLAEGKYVSKEKFDTAELARKNAEDKLAELQKIDTAGLQAENEQLKKDLEATKLSAKVDAALMGAKAVNVTAVKALLDMSKISLDGDKLVGADEQIKTLKETQKWAFEQPYVPGAPGNPVPPADPGQQGTFGDAIKERLAGQ